MNKNIQNTTILLISSLLLIGCTTPNKVVEQPQEEKKVVLEQEVKIESDEALFLIEPSIDAKRVVELSAITTSPYGVYKNQTGTPQTLNNEKYDENAVVLVGNQNSIMSYEGYTILDSFEGIPTYKNVIDIDSTTKKPINDATAYRFVLPTMDTYFDETYTPIQQLMEEVKTQDKGRLVYQSGSFKLQDNNQKLTDVEDVQTILNELNLEANDCIVCSKLDDKGEQEALVAVQADGTIKEELHVSKDLHVVSFINGYVVMENMDSKKKTIYDTNQQMVIGTEYDEVKYFVNGYCPVSNNGKWTFLDESGNLVSDFIFQDVSTVFEGKAFVKVNNLFGVLRLQDTIDFNIPITMESCKIDPTIEEVVEEVKEEVKANEPKKQMLKVKVEGLNIRKKPTQKSETNGQVKQGDTYQYIDHKDAEGYKWFKIGEDKWIADNGQWFDLYAE